MAARHSLTLARSAHRSEYAAATRRAPPATPAHLRSGMARPYSAGPEPAQPQAVGDHEHGAERHRGGGDQRVEEPEGGQRDGGGVVAERPEQVALDRGQRPPGQRDRVRERRAGRRGPGSGRTPRSRRRSPVPIARPRSAWASAAASLTPSPAIATTRPACLQLPDRRDLAGGQHPGDHLVDADRVGDGAGGALVVAGQQHRAQPHGAQPGDRLGRGGLDRVGDDEHAADLAVPADEHDGLPGGLRGLVGRRPSPPGSG